MIIGWLSPDADLIECDYTEHFAVAEEICKNLGIELDKSYASRADDYLLNHGWAKLTMTTLMDFGWNIVFPFNYCGLDGHLSQAQHDFLAPLVLENKDLLSGSCEIMVSMEFEDILY